MCIENATMFCNVSANVLCFACNGGLFNVYPLYVGADGAALWLISLISS